MEAENILPQLTPEEIRVIGVLIEKSKTTPDYYPLTLNAIVTACNQKSSRNPIVEYDEATVIETLDALRKKQLAGTVIGAGSRATKYRHSIATKFPLDPAELSIICLLFLRGPLTAGEINSNSGRLYEFDDLSEVQSNLNRLSEANFVKQLPKITGQKEGRFCHLFAEIPDLNSLTHSASTKETVDLATLEARIEKMENGLIELKGILHQLVQQVLLIEPDNL